MRETQLRRSKVRPLSHQKCKAFSCPRCGAVPNQPCQAKGHHGRIVHVRPHLGRIMAWEQQQ